MVQGGAVNGAPRWHNLYAAENAWLLNSEVLLPDVQQWTERVGAFDCRRRPAGVVMADDVQDAAHNEVAVTELHPAHFPAQKDRLALGEHRHVIHWTLLAVAHRCSAPFSVLYEPSVRHGRRVPGKGNHLPGGRVELAELLHAAQAGRAKDVGVVAVCFAQQVHCERRARVQRGAHLRVSAHVEGHQGGLQGDAREATARHPAQGLLGRAQVLAAPCQPVRLRSRGGDHCDRGWPLPECRAKAAAQPAQWTVFDVGGDWRTDIATESASLGTVSAVCLRS
mmetsp:Transcript_3504/g.12630  ORF Transcript_3504/g.12630 Transcript_3504/m.12630 type:complete len:280 (+) Transcript_3504:58-897(+)